MKVKKSGLVLAGVAAALLASGVVVAAGTADKNHGKVKCEGGNACKGKGACKTPTSSCQGQNSCKGKSWVMTDSEKECKDAGGKVAK